MSKNKFNPDYSDDPEVLHGLIKDLLESTGNLQARIEELEALDLCHHAKGEPCGYSQETMNAIRKERDKLQAQLKGLESYKEFARKVIRDYCWGNYLAVDVLEIQDLAEKLGLIVPHIATAEDVDEESDFEIGDTIYKFNPELLKE